jgi:hypothetical protein
MTVKLQIPNPKLQRSSKFQQNPKTQQIAALPRWDFVFFWCLKFDVWSFFGAWILVLGAL